MSGDVYVYSTLTNDNAYGPHEDGGGDLPSRDRQVVILGGANRADRDNRLWTPRGMGTRITQEQLALCMADSVFLLHKENGYITVSEHEENADDVAAADHEGRSPDAPITPEQVALENASKPEDKRQEVTSNVGAVESERPARAVPAGTRKAGTRSK